MCHGVVAYVLDWVCRSVLTSGVNSFGDFSSFASIGGLGGIVGGLTVAVKQVAPHRVLPAASSGIATTLIPLLFTVAAVVAFVLSVLSGAELAYALGGTYFSWVYLRFFQRRGDNIGETSDEFAFHTMFPHPIAPGVRLIGAVCYLCVRPTLPKPTGQATNAPVKALAPSGEVDAVDAERRRQRALRVLDARLGDERPDRVAQEV